MVNRNLLRQYELSDDQLTQELAEADFGLGLDWLPLEGQDFREQQVVTGRVLHVSGDGVWVDVGYKSEGVIELREWFDDDAGQIVPPRPGEEVQILLEAVEDENGAVVLSYRKAKRQKDWEAVVAKHKEGDVVTGPVTRKIKGGLLVNIGVNVFLPASQVDIRRPADIGEFIGKAIECKILAIDEVRAISSCRAAGCSRIAEWSRRRSSWPRSSRARSARESSRTSPSSAPSSISVESTACCTSPI